MAGGTYIEDLGRHVGETVTLRGWLYNSRHSGKLYFLLVRDGTGTVQGVVSRKDVDDATWQACEAATQEAALVMTGSVRADERAPGGFELTVSEVRIVSLAVDYPITPKEHGTDFLMDHRHLWLRSSRQHAILRVRHELVSGIRDFLNGHGFTLVDAPIFTPNACEGTSNLFETDYFDEKAYLTQSGQLYMEAGAMAFGRAYCFGPTFRAEKSKTRRHLTEFWMVEPEVAWADLDDNMRLIEEFVSALVGRVLDRRKEELKRLERDTTLLEKAVPPFPRVHYDEAAASLLAAGADFQYGGDFGGTDETILTESQEKPIFVHRFPAAIKAFYMKGDPLNPALSLSCDLLAPEGYGEIVGGGEREDSLDILLDKIREHGLPESAFSWYLDLRRYGSVPHSGFGLGVERTLAWICGLPHVRETIPFPRMLSRLSP
ncbi:MAG: asparagine--tRNA ligase [Candidatus Eisenbacteria bacterium]|nr:asparagine--tRNA ligase [Candidatus Eisenbacteria bacterium]